MKEESKARFLITTISCILAVTYTILFFAPIELYLSNKGYFFFGGSDIVPFAFCCCVTALVIGTLVFLLIHRFNAKIYSILLVVFWSIGLALYIQGNFLLTDYGVMDGSTIAWSEYRVEGLISVAVFLFIVIGVNCIAWKKGYEKTLKIMQVISICLILVQSITIGVLLLEEDGLDKSREYVATCDGEMELSSSENFIILMLDSFDSQALAEILKDDNTQKYKDILQDFTYYPDTLGSFSWTDLAFPAIISGQYYRNDCTYGEYLEKAYSESALLNRLKEDNWSCGVYTTSSLPQSRTVEKIDNCRQITRTVSSHKRLAEYMYRLVGFRYLPQPLKKYCWFYPDDMNTSLECAKEDDTDIYGMDNFVFNNKLDLMTATEDKKAFRFYHIDGTHPPFTTTKDFTLDSSKSGDFGVSGIYNEARGMMVLINNFLNEMREQGVYDNSTIIIMADHGYIDLRQSPIFMIKGKNENHDFTQLNTQVTYEDLPEVFQNILDGADTAKTILPVKEKEQRSRIYTYYEWYVDMEEDSHTRDIIEYEVKGNAWDINNIKETGRVYSYRGE